MREVDRDPGIGTESGVGADELSRYLNLFVAESQEHLRVLNGGLLALEEDSGQTAALEQAFRAAHTLKGMAAVMGFDAVVQLAHALEDRLHAVRSGQAQLDAALVDELFGLAGQLERATALATSVAAAESGLAAAKPATAAEAGQETGAAVHSASLVRIDRRELEGLVETAGELAVLHRVLERDSSPAPGSAEAALLARLGRSVAELTALTVAMRRAAAGDVFGDLPRAVRQAARESGRQVALRLEGAEIQVDRGLLESLYEPLLHLLRNAVAHGIEAPAERQAAGKPVRGSLLLRFRRAGSTFEVQVADDGRGVDREKVGARAREAGLLAADVDTATLGEEDLLRILVRPGLSTAEQVTESSGRGVGLDVVVQQVQRLGGQLELETAAGTGTTLTLRVPVSFAVIQALLVGTGEEVCAIPLDHVIELVELQADGEAGSRAEASSFVDGRGREMRYLRLDGLVGAVNCREPDVAVVLGDGESLLALGVQELVGREQVLVQAFDAPPGTLPCFSGAILLADGQPALVMDPVSIL